MKTGKLYIISAPSGAGKTSLVKQLITDLDLLTVSISHTTRNMRTGEQHGKDYYFIEMDEYKKMIAEHAFLEYAKVFDNFYGTARQSVENFLEKGSDVILEIDWQGARQVRNMISDSISIFILPPSIGILRKRLESRGQDSKEVIERRMGDAINEMRHYKDYDYLVVNDDFPQALSELKSIIICHRLERKRQLENKLSLLKTLISHDGISSPSQN
jgi:guanylate kinase